MSYKVDRVFDSDGTELSNALHTTSLAGAAQMAHDGRYIWVTCTAGIAIYEWWGAASDDEPLWENLDELVYARYDIGLNKKLRLVTFITVDAGAFKRTTQLESMQESGATKYTLSYFPVWAKTTARTGVAMTPYWIKKCGDKMYVTGGSTFSYIYSFDIDTQNLLAQIDVRETYTGLTTEFFATGVQYGMKSNLGLSGGKLWFTGSAFGDDSPQKLYSYNPVNAVKTTTDIPVRPSLARTFIATGYNGSVYITNYNNVSVTRFNDITGVFGATIRVNAFATQIFTTSDRRIWVASFGGMLTLVDWDDDGVHNDWSTGVGDTQRATSLSIDQADSSRVWFTNKDNLLVRHDLNTHQQLETSVPIAVLIGEGNSYTLPNGETYFVENPSKDATLKFVDPVGVIQVLNPKESMNVIGSNTEDTSINVLAGSADIKSSADWIFTNLKLTLPEQLWISKQFTYQNAALTDVVVKPYMFVINSGKLLAWKLDRYLYRDVYATVNGQAAVAESPQLYFGE